MSSASGIPRPKPSASDETADLLVWSGVESSGGCIEGVVVEKICCVAEDVEEDEAVDEVAYSDESMPMTVSVE